MTQSNSLFAKLLLPYCDNAEIEAFQTHLQDHPVSGLIRNTYHDCGWNKEGLRHDEEDDLLYRFDKETCPIGKSLFHFAGGCYLLDPSSATISFYLKDLLPKNFVSLDLCGAPGGKTISLAFRRKDGFFLCNDLSYQRANETRKNFERLGLINAVSLSMDPSELSLESSIDCVILDVPCSGSGMIRKEEKMKEDWSEEKVRRLLPIQSSLLEKAYFLLKKEGILAYSTCSLSIEEDECQIKDFLIRHPDMEIIPVNNKKGMIEGKGGIGVHMIPGLYDGEGIYFCLIRKKAGKCISLSPLVSKEKPLYDGTISFTYKKNTYVVSKMWKEFTTLPFVAPGLKVKDDSSHPKCEFDHALSKVDDRHPKIELDEKEAISYAQGNEAHTTSKEKDGLCILTYRGLVLGWGKKVGSRIKNYLPKGLRENLVF